MFLFPFGSIDLCWLGRFSQFIEVGSWVKIKKLCLLWEISGEESIIVSVLYVSHELQVAQTQDVR